MSFSKVRKTVVDTWGKRMKKPRYVVSIQSLHKATGLHLVCCLFLALLRAVNVFRLPALFLILFLSLLVAVIVVCRILFLQE